MLTCRAEHVKSYVLLGSQLPATLNINGLQVCKLPANAPNSSKIKLSNPTETISQEVFMEKKRERIKKAVAALD